MRGPRRHSNAHHRLRLPRQSAANSKAAAGRARKEENANSKKAEAAAKAEAAEAAKWEQGGKVSGSGGSDGERG